MNVDSDSDLLARVDERTARMEEDIRAIRSDLRHRYVTRDLFLPVRNIVYGFVGLVLVLVSTALVSGVVVR